MASVTSLDQDMRNLRLGRYTPQAANETRQWIEESLGRSIPPGDLLDALKDGVALCELANNVLPPPGIKFKKSGMPFIQMENISHFLRACEMPPLNMPAHDRFLTVDLFESKDPAQVLQCLGAFSRQAHAVKPTVFRSTIGPKKAANPLSPNGTGSGMNGRSSMYGAPVSQTRGSDRMRPMSPARTGGSTGSGSGSVSSW
ncbi:calponin, partial [Oleoguttula sp. CCFEE 5521]